MKTKKLLNSKLNNDALKRVFDIDTKIKDQELYIEDLINHRDKYDLDYVINMQQAYLQDLKDIKDRHGL